VKTTGGSVSCGSVSCGSVGGCSSVGTRESISNGAAPSQQQSRGESVVGQSSQKSVCERERQQPEISKKSVCETEREQPEINVRDKKRAARNQRAREKESS
jgi:hypothetical protein